MPKFIKHSFTLLLLVVVLATGTVVVINQTHEAQAQASNPACPYDNQISIDNVATSGVSLAPGPHQLSLSASSLLAPTIQSVKFTLDGESNPIGRGIRVSNPYWSMQWYTQVTPPGVHTVAATLTLTGGTTCTISYPSQVAINTTGTAAASLSLRTIPLQFEGFTNEPRDFTLTSTIDGTTAGPDVTAWTVYKKIPVSLGVVSPQDTTSFFHFSAGTVPGISSIAVTAYYGGASRVVNIPVKVYAQTTTNSLSSGSTSTTTSSTAGTTTTSTSGSTTSTTPSTTSGSITGPASSPISVETDPTVKSCVVSKLSDERYVAINSGQSRVTADEFETLRLCFAIRNYVLPSSLVPVATNKVKESPISSDIKVAGITNSIDKSKSTTKQALKFSGQAKPNTTVLLYVFSEPLVLSTSTDANGDWSYSLEDPMQPGKHEVYALVNKGDGNYERSSVFSFAIAKAEAASANPNGYSLQLERNQPTAAVDSYTTKLYIAAIITLIVVVLATFRLVYTRRQKKLNLPSVIAVNSPDQSISDPSLAIQSPIQPEVPAAVPVSSVAPTPQTVTLAPSAPQPAVSEPKNDTDNNPYQSS